MNKYHSKRTDFLGLSYDKAKRILNRKVLLYLAQKCSMDSCYRCGDLIDNYKDITIEHKEPWMGNDPEAFWDLENIAFSHFSCNSSAGARGDPSKCKYGHALDKNNLYIQPSNGKRFCRICKKRRQEEFLRRREEV